MSYDDHIINPSYAKFLYDSHIIIHNLLIKNNITYYSSGGTTLGAIRCKGIIPHDNDIDIEISDRDVQFLMSKDFKLQLFKKGYKIKYHRESNESKYDWIKIISIKKIANKKADIDLFPIYFGKDYNNNLRTYFSSKYVQELWPKSFLYINELLPLKQVKFGNGIMIVPNKSEKYLNRLFSGWKKQSLITQDPNTHYYLDNPIKVKGIDITIPAKKFASISLSNKQIILDKNDTLLTLCGYGWI